MDEKASRQEFKNTKKRCSGGASIRKESAMCGNGVKKNQTRNMEVKRIRSAAKERHAGEPNGKGGDKAAAKDEDHDRYDKENQIRRQNVREQVGGSVNCWPLIVKSVAPTRMGGHHDAMVQ